MLRKKKKMESYKSLNYNHKWQEKEWNIKRGTIQGKKKKRSNKCGKYMNINGLNTPIKKQKLSEMIENMIKL